MQLKLIDWVVVAAYAVLSLAIGLRFARRAGRSLEQYFLSGRTAPWWLLGTSMVATTFSADTPNLVTDLVRRRRQHELAVVGVPDHRHADSIFLRFSSLSRRRRPIG